MTSETLLQRQRTARAWLRTLVPLALPAVLLLGTLLVTLLVAPPVALGQDGAQDGARDGAREEAQDSPPPADGAAAREVYNPGDDAPADGETAGEAAEADGDGEELEVFVDTVDVRVVNVDVYVTDKKGNRVTGLTRDDFEIREDGRPMQITNFYAVEGGRPVEEPADGETDGAEEDGAPAYPSLEGLRPLEEPQVPDDQRLFLIVYIDNFNIEPIHRNRVLDELGYFLIKELDRGDRVMLVTYDRSLKIRRPFTADPDLVARTLDEVKRVGGWGPSRRDERRQIMDRIRDARSPSQALSYARLHAESMENDLRFTIGALKEMIGNLGGLPGRKAIVYVSDGIPMVPGQDMFAAVDARFGAGVASTDSFHYDASREFEQLANLANANRVTFYTIDAAGLRLASSFSAENRDPSLGLQVDSTYNTNHQTPLRFLADTTGGVAVLNTNNILTRMDAVGEDFDTFYSLGYSPGRAGSGRYHEIDVRVKGRRDLTVRHREGYRDKTVEARMTDTTISALNFGFADNPLGVSLAFADAAPRDGRFYTQSVHVDIPIGEMVLVPRGDTHEGRLRLFIAAMDERGDSSPVQQVPVPVSIPSDEVERARRQDYRYTVTLLMRPGRQQVAVGVRDDLGSKESFIVQDVLVGTQRRGG